MFLLHFLFSFTVIFWLSAAVADTLLAPHNLRRLSPAIRVGVGYLALLLWLSVAWKFVPILWAWMSGIALLFGLRYRWLYSKMRECQRSANRFIRRYLISFAGYLLLANLFLLPLHIGGTYGPFTEGGGDVSIYAETAKYMVDHNLPAYGLSDLVNDIRTFISAPMEVIRYNQSNMSKVFTANLASPPRADASSFTLVSMQRYPSIQFAPTAMWFFLSGDMNYVVFYSTLAFFYALTLAGLWVFFRLWGLAPAILAVTIAGFSHGLASIGYNVYLIQSMSVAIATLFLAVTPFARPFTRTGLYLYGPGLALMSSAYIHFLTLCLPLLMMAQWVGGWLGENNKKTTGKVLLTTYLTAGAALFIIGVSVLGDLSSTLGSYGSILGRLFNTLMATISGTVSTVLDNDYMGSSITFGSEQWLSFIFGSHSQQHFPPYVQPNILSTIGAYSGYIGLLSMSFSWLILTVTYFWNQWGEEHKTGWHRLWWLSGAILLGVVFHLVISQQSLYTQAKGAQDTLPYVFVLMIIPFAVLTTSSQNFLKLRWKIISLILLLSFIAGLTVSRMYHASVIGHNQERAIVMSTSFFEEAKRIRVADADPFVLFEPRSSADVYLSAEPFFGARMIPTRHLALQIRQWDSTKPRYAEMVSTPVIGTELVKETDIEHLWTLVARPINHGTNFLSGTYRTTQWVGKKLSDSTEPEIIYSAANYERGGRAVMATGCPESLDYVRNGGAIAILPSGSAYRLSVCMSPVSPNDFEKMVSSLTAWGKSHPGPDMQITPPFIKMVWSDVTSEDPRLLDLFRYEGEVWVGVTWEKISATIANGASG